MNCSEVCIIVFFFWCLFFLICREVLNVVHSFVNSSEEVCVLQCFVNCSGACRCESVLWIAVECVCAKVLCELQLNLYTLYFLWIAVNCVSATVFFKLQLNVCVCYIVLWIAMKCLCAVLICELHWNVCACAVLFCELQWHVNAQWRWLFYL